MGEVIVLHLGVGDLPANQVKKYVEEVRKNIREVIGEEQKLLIMPQRQTHQSHFETLILSR